MMSTRVVGTPSSRSITRVGSPHTPPAQVPLDGGGSPSVEASVVARKFASGARHAALRGGRAAAP